ncbi:MAG: hypothetical protein ACJ0RB_05055 [Candidatus Azotimanducaceae bacterium]
MSVLSDGSSPVLVYASAFSSCMCLVFSNCGVLPMVGYGQA